LGGIKVLWWCIGIFIVGGMFGMIITSLLMVDKQEDKNLKSDDAPVECFWYGERMMKTNKGLYICPVCGWRYRRKSDE